MTAVDHAELKRADMKPEDVLAVLRADRLPECSFDSGRTWEVDGVIVAETFTRCADLIDALLSEIEGLKAERDAYREAAHLEAVCGDDAERQLDAFRTQAPDSWRPIETAPKDGTHFLAVDESGDACRAAYHRDGYLMAFCGQPVVEPFEPVLWMPWTSTEAALRPQTAESGE